MAGVQLNNGLIKAVEQIVAQFGKDVLKEERFVNILQDLYPDRDNPAVFRIIKTMIIDGISKDLKDWNISCIQSKVGMCANVLSQKYGYDKDLIEGLLFSISIGIGNISLSDYNNLLAFSSSQRKKQRPSQKTTPQRNPKKPLIPRHSTNNQQPSQSSQYGMTVKYFFLFLWGFLVLFFSPVIYLEFTNKGDWWPFFAIIPIAFLQFVSVVMLGVTITADENTPNPLVGGLYSGLAIFASLFWLFLPIVLGYDLFGLYNILAYYGFYREVDHPSILTILLCVIFSFFCFIFVPETVRFSGIIFDSKKKFRNNIGLLLKEKTFKNGFLLSCIFFLLVGFIGVLMPFIWQIRMNYRIERYNERTDSLNAQSELVGMKRSQLFQPLSFCGFKLGTQIDSCVSVAERLQGSEIVSKSSLYRKLEVKDVDYSSLVDTTLYVSTQWDNNDIVVLLHFMGKKLIGVSYNVNIEKDSLISMFTSKYGSPEFHISKIEKLDKDYYLNYYSEMFLKKEPSPNDYYWTFLNGIIQISKDESGTLSHDYTFYDSFIISYFDRRCEKILKEKISQQKRWEVESKKRQQDSLRLIEDEYQKQKEIDRERLEKNHKESIEQI